MIRLPFRLPVFTAAFLALGPLHPAMAQQVPETKPLGDMKLRDFAVKWMMQQDDLAEVGRYAQANRDLMAGTDTRPRLVLMGDSITFHWRADGLPSISGLNLVNRGIPGQNTSQMLLRFEDDVIALNPVAVMIFGGVNDARIHVGDPAAPVAATGVLDRVRRNITAMADIARGRGVKVVLCTLPPFAQGHPELGRDPATIVRVNDWIRAFAAERGYPVADFHAILAGADGFLPDELTVDGLHPTSNAYRRMAAPLEAAVRRLKLLRTLP